MQYKCITMYYIMKISKTFRLSEEAIDILNKQDNQAQYLENLILSKTNPAPSNSMLESIREIIKQELKAHSPQVANSSPHSPQKIEPVYSSVPSEPAKIKSEINQLKIECDDKLEQCQDPQLAKRIATDYELRIQTLWDKYWMIIKGEQI